MSLAMQKLLSPSNLLIGRIECTRAPQFLQLNEPARKRLIWTAGLDTKPES